MYIGIVNCINSDDKQIHDIDQIKIGDTIKRKWPYAKGDTYYHCKVLHVKIRPLDQVVNQEAPVAKKPAEIETIAVLRLKTLLDEAKKEIENLKSQISEIKESAESKKDTQATTQSS